MAAAVRRAVLASDSPLDTLRANFLATSTQSMPIAGMIFWFVVAMAGLLLPPRQVAFVVGFGSGAIFPLAMLIDRLRGRTLARSSTANPVVGMFLQSLATVALLWPLVIIAAARASDPEIIVLGGAILMALVWIPYGWAADDPAGLHHAIARCVLSYAAFLLTPAPFKTPVIAIIVLLCYGYSLFRMRRPDPAAIPKL
jgi:hypothetical protein